MSRTVKRLLLLIAALVALVAVPLGFYSRNVLRDNAFEQQVADVVAEWDPSGSVVRVDASTDGTGATVELDVTGPRKPEPAWRLAELLSERRGERVTVELSYTLTQEDRAVSSG